MPPPEGRSRCAYYDFHWAALRDADDGSSRRAPLSAMRSASSPRDSCADEAPPPRRITLHCHAPFMVCPQQLSASGTAIRSSLAGAEGACTIAAGGEAARRPICATSHDRADAGRRRFTLLFYLDTQQAIDYHFTLPFQLAYATSSARPPILAATTQA